MFLAILGRNTPVHAQFASGVSLVEVYATVLDSRGQPVTGLTRGDFIVEEDGVVQPTSAFAFGEFPLSLAIGIDRSFSVPKAQLAASASALTKFLGELRPEDETMIIAIGSQTEVLTLLSRDRGAAVAALNGITPWGTTPLFDASLAAIAAIQPGKGRRALVLISDGVDRYSVSTAGAVLDAARRMDVLIYPIIIGKSWPPIFADIAAASGGRVFQADDVRRLPNALSAIAQDLRSQYLIGYEPLLGAQERHAWRSIRVRVKQPGLTVRAREGYILR